MKWDYALTSVLVGLAGMAGFRTLGDSTSRGIAGDGRGGPPAVLVSHQAGIAEAADVARAAEHVEEWATRFPDRGHPDFAGWVSQVRASLRPGQNGITTLATEAHFPESVGRAYEALTNAAGYNNGLWWWGPRRAELEAQGNTFARAHRAHEVVGAKVIRLMEDALGHPILDHDSEVRVAYANGPPREVHADGRVLTATAAFIGQGTEVVGRSPTSRGQLLIFPGTHIPMAATAGVTPEFAHISATEHREPLMTPGATRVAFLSRPSYVAIPFEEMLERFHAAIGR